MSCKTFFKEEYQHCRRTDILEKLNLATFLATKQFIPLFSNEQPDWSASIKGSPGGYNPALEFFLSLSKYFPEYPFINLYILPEASITEILPWDVSDEFIARQVDFYLPQAKLVIEIDGSQHQTPRSIRPKEKYPLQEK